MSTQKPTGVCYATAARDYMKSKRKALGGSKQLFVLLYDREPVGNENQTFINYINRGKYSSDFLGLCTEKLGLHEVTLQELFGFPNKC